jgi:hypothetical protein
VKASAARMRSSAEALNAAMEKARRLPDAINVRQHDQDKTTGQIALSDSKPSPRS